MPSAAELTASLHTSPIDSPASGATADLVTTGGDGPPENRTSEVPLFRYHLGDEIARGGMGIIYRATDTALGREVAVKVLQDKYDLASGTARRFADEARITAQLQHPGIPPVHDLGTLPDGRPFLAMKFIKGKTLDELLKDRTDPSAERGRFLAAFEQVCQAIAYAHAHDVIHRDLKPANVMVGAFGEVQVMDWGLAKVLASRERERPEYDPEQTAGSSVVHSLRDPDGSFTQAGSILGTPAFMPPEQALGAIGKVDERSDVFGLGAVLAVILTGKPPFAGNTGETVRIQAAQGKVADCYARLDACEVEPEWIDLAKRCLSPAPKDRPIHAGEVARAVADLRSAADERARRAELDKVKAEGERAAALLQAAEQRKRRRAQGMLAVAVGVLVLAGGAFARRHEEQGRTQRERLARNSEAVSGLLEQTADSLTAGDAAKATVLLQAAEKRAAEGGAESLAGRLEFLKADLAVLGELDAVDRFRWTAEENRLPDSAKVAERFREVLEKFGADPDLVEPAQAAARVKDSTVRERLLGGLDHLLRHKRSPRVREALREIDPDPYRDAIRDAVLSANRAREAEQLRKLAALEQPSWFAQILGESPAIGVERRRELLAAAIRQSPANLGLLMTMGLTYPMQKANSPERLRWNQAALAVDPKNPVILSLLARSLLFVGDKAGSEAAIREALRLDPKFSLAHNYLGTVLREIGDDSGAADEFREAVRLDPTYPNPHNNLGTQLYKAGDKTGAEAEYREAIRLMPKYADAHYRLGNLLLGEGDKTGAEAEYREAVRHDPKYSPAHYPLGNLLSERGDKTAAEAEYRQALRSEPNLVSAHYNLGTILGESGRFEAAAEELRAAVRLDPKNAAYKRSLAKAERCMALLARLPDVVAGRAEPKTAAEMVEFAYICERPSQKRYADAVRLYEKAIAADPNRGEGSAWVAIRYYAACAAVQAGFGLGLDPPSADGERAALREKARNWLKGNLTFLQKLMASPNTGFRAASLTRLKAWLAEGDLDSTRSGQARTAMSPTERAEWDQFWTEVKSTIEAAEKPKPAAERLPMPRVKE